MGDGRVKKGRIPVRGPATDRDVIAAIGELRGQGYGPAEIQRRLARDHTMSDRLPGPATIKKYAARAKPEAIVDPWRLGVAEPDEVAAIVPIIAAVVDRTAGRVRQVSKREAVLLTRLVRAAPTLDPWDAYRLARRLIGSPDDESNVLLYLGLRPWEGEAERERYERAAGANAIHSPYVEGSLALSGSGSIEFEPTVRRGRATRRKETNQ